MIVNRDNCLSFITLVSLVTQENFLNNVSKYYICCLLKCAKEREVLKNRLHLFRIRKSPNEQTSEITK